MITLMIPPRDPNANLVAPPPAISLPIEPAATVPPIVMATAVDPPIAAPTATTTTTTSASPAPTASTPEDRGTAFQPTEGGSEMRSGETLLVEAYVVRWLILMGWLYLVWRRQSALSAQLDDLEKTIDKAAASKKPEKK